MKRTYTVLDPSAPPARLAPPGGCALGVMIKAPRAGASKTRLVPPLTHREAAALSVCFLRDTAANIAAACESAESIDGGGAASGVAVYTPAGAEEAFEGLLPEGFSLLAQRGEGFGERLFNAADDLLRLGYDSLCLIDSDSPTLPTRALAAACESAERIDGGSAASGVAVYTPAGAEEAFEGLLPEGFSLLAQRGEGFGERLFNAADDLLRLGYDSLCLIDSDSPTLPTRALAAAVEELSRPGDRAVLGPADDGGYYLIGVKRAHRQLFERIDWSTGRVLQQTVERACEIDLDVALLPAWYDVDDSVTLARLCGELFGGQAVSVCAPHGAALKGYEAAHTRAHLAGIIEREGRARVWPASVDSKQAADGEGSVGDAAQTAEAPR